MTFFNSFPQRGIVMGITEQTAQVYIPLAKYETDYIDSTVMLTSDMVGQEVIVVFVNGDRNQGVIIGLIDRKYSPLKGTLQDVSGTVSLPDINYTGVMDSLVTLSDALIGHEVAVIFSGGDFDQGVIVGVKP